MRHAAGAVALSVLFVTPVLADPIPQRAPGLWESKTTADSGSTVAKQCVGTGTDQAVVGGMAGGACAKVNVTKTSAGYQVETECAMGPIKASGRSLITGDLQTAMHVEGSTTLTGVPGQSGAVERRIVLDAKRLGGCEPGQKPGDVILPNGKVISMPQAAPRP